MNGRYYNGRYTNPVYGSTFAGVIWKKIMVKAVEGMEIKKFAKADSKLLVSPKKQIPNVNGQSVDNARRTLEAAGFSVTVDNQPVKSEYKPGSVASTSPDGGTYASAGISVTISVSAGGGGGGDEGDNEGDNRGRGNGRR